MQILYQLLSSVVAGAWSFVLTLIILQILGTIPFLRLKLTEQEEALGSDWIELGELASKKTYKLKHKNIYFHFINCYFN
jgi:Amt family ammonium transporter